jgi:release factor glutamine methyltransferase
MLTILQAIQLSTEYLEKKGIESPRTNAELLLADILNCKRLDLYLSFEKPLADEEINLYREHIKRRGNREPLQYIVKDVEFFGLKFHLNKNVLIPRPETEILVEKIIEENKILSGLKILDIGTGSGIIAVCLAKFLTQPVITAIDISEDALKTAGENAINNFVDDKICFKKSDITSDLMDEQFDIVVSNPPYISGQDFETLEPELKVYEPKAALTDLKDGLSFYRTISEKSKLLLKENGKIYLEIGKDQASQVVDLLERNFRNIKIYKDYSDIERIITGELI